MLLFIEGLRWFVRVAECHSFSAVARENMISQATISRRISTIESHFKVSLFRRSTRNVALTEEGRNFLPRARRILTELEATENAMDRDRAQESGHVRVGTTNAFGLHLARALPEFHRRFPGLCIEMVLSDGFVNMIEEGLDLALRTGQVNEASLVARHLGDVPRHMVASPAYLASHGMVEDPAALQHHECVLFSYGATRQIWNIGESPVRVSGSYRTNSSIAQLEAVQNGMGISLFPHFQVEEGIRTGRLIRLLPDVPIEPISFYLTYPAHQTLPPRTRIVIKWIVSEARRFIILDQPLPSGRKGIGALST